MFDLTGKVALVTGGSKGIGRGCALALAAAGADVAVNGHRDLEAGERTAEDIRAAGRRSVFVAADVTDPQAVQAMVDRTVEELGGLDVAVNNAMSPISGGDVFSARALESWPRALDRILSAPFYCCRAAGMHMSNAGGGAIVNIASTGRGKSPATGSTPVWRHTSPRRPLSCSSHGSSRLAGRRSESASTASARAIFAPTRRSTSTTILSASPS